MPTILLVRHGETDWNRSGQIMGAQPIPLNSTGTRQAEELAIFLKGRAIGALFSSPVTRALQTAEILASCLALPVRPTSGLSEIGFGDWINRYWRDIAQEPAKQNFYTSPHEARPPGGETLVEVQARAVAAVELAAVEVVGGSSLFVSHADVIRTVLAHYLHLDFVAIRQARIDHASLTALHLTEQGTELVCLNVTPLAASLA
ncbi:MAG: histidine phosphatase family protein [Nitrospiraceae bacterium]